MVWSKKMKNTDSLAYPGKKSRSETPWEEIVLQDPDLEASGSLWFNRTNTNLGLESLDLYLSY